MLVKLVDVHGGRRRADGGEGDYSTDGLYG